MVQDGVACLWCVQSACVNVRCGTSRLRASTLILPITSLRSHLQGTHTQRTVLAVYSVGDPRRQAPPPDPWNLLSFLFQTLRETRTTAIAIAITTAITTHHGRLERPQTEQQRQAGAPRRSCRRQGRSPSIPMPCRTQAASRLTLRPQSSLVLRFVNNDFQENKEPTIGGTSPAIPGPLASSREASR